MKTGYSELISLRKSGGFTLIEVLISVLVLAVGLLGLAGLQATGLRSNHSAYLRTQASLLAYDIADSMRANRVSALAGEYNIALGGTAPTGSAVVATDLTRWLDEIATELPGGQGAVVAGAGTNFTITVRWNDREAALTSFLMDTTL